MFSRFVDEELTTLAGFLTCREPEKPLPPVRLPSCYTNNSADSPNTKSTLTRKSFVGRTPRGGGRGPSCHAFPDEEMSTLAGFLTCADPERHGASVMADSLDDIGCGVTQEFFNQLMLANDDNSSILEGRCGATSNSPKHLSSSSRAANARRNHSSAALKHMWSKIQPVHEEVSMFADFLTCRDPESRNPSSPRHSASPPQHRPTLQRLSTKPTVTVEGKIFSDSEPSYSSEISEPIFAKVSNRHPKLTLPSLDSEVELQKVFEDDEFVTFRKNTGSIESIGKQQQQLLQRMVPVSVVHGGEVVRQQTKPTQSIRTMEYETYQNHTHHQQQQQQQHNTNDYNRSYSNDDYVDQHHHHHHHHRGEVAQQPHRKNNKALFAQRRKQQEPSLQHYYQAHRSGRLEPVQQPTAPDSYQPVHSFEPSCESYQARDPDVGTSDAESYDAQTKWSKMMS